MKAWLLIAAINGFVAVAAGAFAAHALQGTTDARALVIFETGARYQMYHALVITNAAIAMRVAPAFNGQLACALFLVGIVLFSGSLYLFALTHAHALAFVTPFGGLAFLAGWAALAYAAFNIRSGT